MNVQEFLNLVLKDTVSIFSILNPISAGAIMLSLISDATKKEINTIAWKHTLTVFIGCFVVLLTGGFILMAFSISVDSIRAIGGVILLLMSIKMIQGEGHQGVNHSPKEQQSAMERQEIAVIPLAIPISLGPGLFATLITMQPGFGEPLPYAALIISLIISVTANYLVMRNMPRIRKLLGVNGMKVFSRLMGLIVGALSFQFLVAGVKGMWDVY